MLIDWPEFHAASERVFQQVLRRQMAQASPLSTRARRVTIVEGTRIDIEYPNGSRQTIAPERHEVSLSLPVAETPFGLSRLRKVTQQFGRLLGDDMSKTMIDQVMASDSPVFGRFGGQTPEELAAQMVDALRKMHVDFDEDGKPTFEFLVHPQNLLMLRSIDTPEYQQRFDAVIEEKRREWIDRESHRELAD